MFLSLFSDSKSLSEDSWGPFSPLTVAKEAKSQDISEFIEAVKKVTGSLEFTTEELVHYYQRYVNEGFSIDEICELIARDHAFKPLTQYYSYHTFKGADLGAASKEQDFQLAFKQKAKSGFKSFDYQKKNALRRLATMKRLNQKQSLTKEQERERKMQMDRMSKMKGQKYRERARWNDRSSFYSKPLASSVEIRSSWESKGAFAFPKLQKEEYRHSIKSEVLLEAGYVHFYNSQMDQITTRKAKKLSVPREPKYTYYSVKTMEDKNLQRFADESNAAMTVVISDRILSLIMASTRSVLSWDIVVIKKDGKLYFDKRNNKQRVDILSVDETSRSPPDISEDANDINSEYNLAMEATRINLQFQRFAVQAPQNPESGPGVLNLDDSEPHPFKKDDQIPAPIAFTYKKFHLNSFDVICRCEIDGAIGDEDNYRLVAIKALNEWKPKSQEDWRSLLDGSQGRVITTEIKNNACKFARWVAQATLSGTEEMKIGFVSRVDSRKKSPHVVLGVGTYSISSLTQQIGLTKRNMWGALNSIVTELMRVEDGKYTLVKLPNKQTIQLYRISSSVTGSLVFRKTGSGDYQFLVLKSGDNLVSLFSKTDHGEDNAITARRSLKRDLGISEGDISFCRDYKYASQFEDPETYEERTEVMFACCLKDASFDLNLSENYGDFEWRDIDDTHSLDSTLRDVLSHFSRFASSKGGMDRCF